MKKFIKKYFDETKQKLHEYGTKKIIFRISTIILTITFAVLFIYFGSKITFIKNDYNISWSEVSYRRLTKAKVVEITDEEYPEDKSYTVHITYKCEILQGDYKGEIASIDQYLNEYTSNFVRLVEKGDIIYVMQEDLDDSLGVTWYFAGDSFSFDHITGLIILGVIFALLVILISKGKGLMTLISLALTCLSILFVFLPAILVAKNVYVYTIIICAFVITVTYLLVVGINKKGICATLGCLSGLLISGILTIIFMEQMNFTGYYVQEDIAEVTKLFQFYYTQGIIIDLKGLIFAATLIGALGAAMDVSLSLASSLKEVYDNAKETSFLKTIKSGFVIGKDMIGTMANTLVLAYIASDLVLILFFMSNHSTGFIMQSEYIAMAITQALIGSIAILITIPLTSIICALLYNKKKTVKSVE